MPHGISVCVTAPAIFKETAHTDPLRHSRAAAALGAEVNARHEEDCEYAGDILRGELI